MLSPAACLSSLETERPIGKKGLGVKKLLVASIAAAAFLSAPAFAEPPPSGMLNWSGFYVGATGGYAWGNPSFQDFNGSGPNVKISGGIFGGELGYNWQAGNIVYGFEADFQNGPKGHDRIGTPGGATFCGSGICRVDTAYFGTVRGRLGYAMNQWLAYGTGGWAFARTTSGVDHSAQEGASTEGGWVAVASNTPSAPS
jgi:outer membrane immunogenic protein